MQYFRFFIFFILSTSRLLGNEDSLRNEIRNHPQNDTLKVWLYNDLGNALIRINPPKARVEYLIGLSLAEKIDFQEGQFELNKNIGTTHYYMGEMDSTYHYWFLAAESVSYSDLKRKGDGFNNLGVYFQKVGLLDSALYYSNESLRLKSMEKDSLRIAASLANLGALYRERGAYVKSLEHLFKALELYQGAGQEKQEADVLNGIGLLYLTLTENEQALDFLEKSLTIRRRLGDRRSILSSLINIGAVHKDGDDYLLAKEIFEECIPLCLELKDQKNLGGVYTNLGNIYSKLENWEKSYEYYMKASVIFENLQDDLNQALILNNLGFLEVKRGRPEKAIDYFTTVLEFTEMTQSMEYRKRIYNGLSMGYEAKGEFEAALSAMKHYQELDDSLFTTEVQDRLTYYQEKFEAAEKENEILKLEQDALRADQEATESELEKNIAILVSILVLVGLFVLYYFYRLRQRLFRQKETIHQKEKERLETEKEKNELEIDSKNRELTSFATYVVQKNELLDRLKETVQLIQSGKGDPIHLKEVEHLIKDGAHVDNDWNTFKLHFENVHPNFFDSLLQKFPKLSSNDLRMCAYMKMNLSTKEMATLMNITAKSVRMNRYRLKKKMELPEEEEVLNFLRHFAHA